MSSVSVTQSVFSISFLFHRGEAKANIRVVEQRWRLRTAQGTAEGEGRLVVDL